MDMPQSTGISDDEKLWALLSYLLTPIVPLIIMFGMEDKKDLPFLRFHYRQALIWGLFWIIAYVIVVGVCLSPVAFIGTIYFAIKAYQGEYVSIPVLTDFARKQGWL
jgi:uncharacterized membrane protein